MNRNHPVAPTNRVSIPLQICLLLFGLISAGTNNVHAEESPSFSHIVCDHFEPRETPGLQHGYVTQHGRFYMPIRDFVHVFGNANIEGHDPAKQ